MGIRKEGAIPTPDELRKLISSPIQTTGRFRLTPIPADTNIYSTAPEDNNPLFPDFLDEPISRTTENNPLTRKADSLPGITTNKGRVNFIDREIARGKTTILANLLGITEKAADRYRKTGSHSGKKGLVTKVRQTYAIAKIMKDHFPGDEFISDRINALKTKDPRFGVSPWELMHQGHIDKALALVERTFRHIHE
nr:hypothetical protein [Candidatus Levybacteria bacterium]